MIEEYIDYLNDIHRSMVLSQRFISGMTVQEFLHDEKTQFAAIRCLEVIGEATKRIPQTFQERNAKIPWKAMAGMRDRSIHGYESVDNELVWKTLSETIPELLPLFENILKSES